MNLIGFVARKTFAKDLEEHGPALTFARLCTSAHLQDLQQIANFTIIFYCVLLYILFPDYKHDPKDGWEKISAVTAVAGAVLSWAYQSASKRIGVVDLFASEIGVICRVCLVVDFAKTSVLLAERPPPRTGPDNGPSPSQGSQATKFTSEEHYTPVYDGSLSDLQPLDVDVVTYVNQFYTYRKTMMDYLRRIAALDTDDQVSAMQAQMIYMQFLMYESARKAIVRLVEFEPDQTEHVITILCSEIISFQFLKTRYKEDFRGKRLDLRVERYQKLVEGDLMAKVGAGGDRLPWQKAKTTLPELLDRYKQVCLALDLAFDPSI